MSDEKTLNWKVGYTHDLAHPPRTFVPAEVPGAVQLDWARANNWPLPETGPIKFSTSGAVVTASDYAWMEDMYWIYQTRLDFAPPAAEQRLFFVCGGVDYACEVHLNGQAIYSHEGMFTPFELDLTGRASPGDLLEVVVFPAPTWHHLPRELRQPVQFCKPVVSYGWDFHPRLNPLGLWRAAYLELRPACHLQSAEVFYELNEDFSKARVRLEVNVSQPGAGFVRWRLLDPEGTPVIEAENGLAQTHLQLCREVNLPRLWWPNGQGDPNLYTSEVDLLDESGQSVNRRIARVGFRRIRLVPHPGNWDDPEVSSFPLTRNKSPLTFEVNGKQIFAKGSNWISPDIFPGRITGETYHPLLDLAQQSHFNLLRCWGGAPAPNDEFFDLCDERGLMVWQEFPLACARYEGTPEYLAVLDQESRSLILRLRSHASLAMWCGGNELFNAWSRMTDQDLALRLLDRNCYDLDPQRPYLMTSPGTGWAHGGYQFKLKNGSEVFQYFAAAHYTGYTEFGIPGPASTETLRRLIPPDELFPPRPGTQWQARHAFNAWDGSSDSWLEQWCIESYFGPANNLEELVAHGQLLQSEGLKFIFEEARRQKPVCSIALSWCFNEPWPTAANNSLVSWPANPKPALGAVSAALRPTLASLRAPKFSWQAGETFRADLFLLNDAPCPLPPGCLEVYLVIGSQRQPITAWDYPEAAANANLPGPALEFIIPNMESELFTIELQVNDHEEWNSQYTLHFRKLASNA